MRDKLCIGTGTNCRPSGHGAICGHAFRVQGVRQD